MKKYKLINNVAGWVVFIIALITYTLTLEPTGSFWDCGEFVSGAYMLEVVHPPGAPLFLLIGRIFTMFAGDPSHVAYTINFFSGLSSALAIMFLFWVITALAKKVVMTKGTEPTMTDIFAVIATGTVGALACTFSDTFWFSAVEGEVYALSTFFIPLLMWGIMRWEASEDERHRDRWLVLIGFFVGLSVGVHLMSLLAVPAMAMVYYFKKYKPTTRGIMAALVVGFLALMVVYVGIVSKLITIFAAFDLIAVNDMGLPFGTGAIVFAVLLVGGIVGGLIYAYRKGMPNLQTALLSLCMILIGFSLYSMVVIRANAIPPINMNKPADIFRLQAYLNREQYGDRPLLYGPHFNAGVKDFKKTGKKYYKDKDKYIVVGDKMEQIYKDEDMMLFPRLGSMEDRHAGAYREMLDLKEGEDPTMGDNIFFFLDYQVKSMWFRYFMWNFAGRQDDLQGRYDNNNGNWISGIKFIDEARLGPMDNLPKDLATNKARNKFYFIPFLLGLLGAVYHYVKRRNDFLVIGTLFVFTGLLEIIFFNSPPFEPRERDYTLVGSFVTYCIWIGFGVLAIFDFLRTRMKPSMAVAIAFVASLTGPVLMAKDGWDDHDRSKRYTARDFAINYLQSCAPNAILFTQGDNDTYPLWYAQEVEGIRKDVRVVNLSLLGVDWYVEQLKYKLNDAEPVKLQLKPEKYIGSRRDQLFVEPSGRAVNKVFELKDALEFVSRDDRSAQVAVRTGEFYNYLQSRNLKITVDSAAVVKNKILADTLLPLMQKEMKFSLGGNRQYLVKNNLMLLDIVASNLWERPIYFAVSVDPNEYLGLGKFFQLEGLAYRILPMETLNSNECYQWFTENQIAKVPNTPQTKREYDYCKGSHGMLAVDMMYDNVMNKFKWGGIELKDTVAYTVQTGDTKSTIADKFNIAEVTLPEQINVGDEIKIAKPRPMYLDENILRMTMNMRSNFARLVEALTNAGENEKALAAIQRCLDVMPQPTVPYNHYLATFPAYLYHLDKKEMARSLARDLAKIFVEEMRYYSDPDVQQHDPSCVQNIYQAYYLGMVRGVLSATEQNDKELFDELQAQCAPYVASCERMLGKLR